MSNKTGSIAVSDIDRCMDCGIDVGYIDSSGCDGIYASGVRCPDCGKKHLKKYINDLGNGFRMLTDEELKTFIQRIKPNTT